jgi:hypothetical protein
MAYSPVPTVTTGDTWSAANHNTYIRDNFAAGVPDIFTAAGDLPYATAANAAAALAIGAAGQVLKVNASGTLPEWSSGNLIDKQILVGSSTDTIEFSSIPQNHDHLKIIMDYVASDTIELYVNINNDFGDNYTKSSLTFNNNTWSKSYTDTGATTYYTLFSGQLWYYNYGSFPGHAEIDIYNYTSSFYKYARIDSRRVTGSSGANVYQEFGEAFWKVTDPITSIQIYIPNAYSPRTLSANSKFMLYGY